MMAVALAASGAPAQQVRPAPGGPVRTLQDLITITSDTPFDQALIMIQQASGLVIVDPGNRKYPIGLDVDRQPWRLALDMIASAHDLKVVKGPGYYMLALRSGEPAQPGAPVEEGPKRPEINADSREVNIAAVFFEADRQTLRELGINWNSLRAGRVEVDAASRAAELVSEPMLSVQATGHLARSLSVDALLKALESRSVGEVISNPQIKVIGGKEGLIQVGQDFSVVTRDFAGNATVEFFKTGTILKVTPAIVTEDSVEFVHLRVEAERSSLIDPARGIINRTTANTSALLFDGEEAAIAGLYVNEVNKTRSGVPLLKDLPTWFFGLRYLFGYNSKQVSKTELVVLIKVDIVPSVRQRIERQLQKETQLEEILRRRQE